MQQLHRTGVYRNRYVYGWAMKKLITFWAVSFIIFWVLSVFAGGDAVSGKIENGHYYLASHGKYTEVSQIVYVLSAGYLTVLFASVAFTLLPCLFVSLKGIRIKDFTKDLSNLYIFVPLLIGCAFLYGAFLALACVLRAFGVLYETRA